ncbi:MAG TPA: CpsB/CapC family capsule biosynthesis tyrosine phosphatase [Gemmatimonadales bacterium]|nr:CpsB/CapC family capsule biosynthesis tyrosine phosphatase [Gemmatimonadales bacterium]
MIDLHCHLLAGIDDGPAEIEGSIALAHAAARAGTETIVATPHVNARYPNAAEKISRLLDELRECLAADPRAPAPQLRAGAEVALAYAAELEDEELIRLHLGGGPWVLLEPPSAPVDFDVTDKITEIASRGHRVLIAHPERCPVFQRDPWVLAGLVSDGALTSVTAAALRGRFGTNVRHFAIELVREQLVHNVASDAHHHEERPPTMTQELERAGLGPLAGWLTGEVPAAILAGEEIPARPEHAGARPPSGVKSRQRP